MSYAGFSVRSRTQIQSGLRIALGLPIAEVLEPILDIVGEPVLASAQTLQAVGGAEQDHQKAAVLHVGRPAVGVGEED